MKVDKIIDEWYDKLYTFKSSKGAREKLKQEMNNHIKELENNLKRDLLLGGKRISRDWCKEVIEKRFHGGENESN